MAVKDYPSSFPNPLIEGYGIDVNMGITRTEFEKGRSRQRRRFTSMPQMFSLSFIVPIAQLGTWQTWINNNAYIYFAMDMSSYITSAEIGKTCSTHHIRFISDLIIAPLQNDLFQVNVSAEMADAASFYVPPIELTDDWVVGKTPGDPSVDWLIAKIPAGPSVGWVVGGTPGHPSSHV